ncbi:glycine betaine ABC transporter substrate-binding protein [Halosquirtibacter xylanolyticus]|uniref:glycine betaine ABC transporter substrate-binding protein n=1 Tax=Halosquirtibacter xylanolyticus TaxID=3374599 RepID=UPI003749A2D1|nr:glycine betaine ABC transporter substrate-binding protein [Prolixibacteraceae bacterium]
MNLNSLVSVLICCCACFACSTSKKKTVNTNDKSRPDVVIAYDHWRQNKAITQFAKRILVSKGYNVKIQPTHNPMEALRNKKVDIVLSDWVPQNIYPEPGPDYAVLGNLYNEALMGVIVPHYTKINSLAELENKENKDSHTIYTPTFGFESECALNEIKKRYNFNLCVERMDQLQMVTLVKDRLQKKQDVFIVGCYPHPMINKKLFKIVEDPYHAFATKYQLVKVCSRSWAKKHPKLEKFFKNFQFETSHFEKLIELTDKNKWDTKVSIDEWYQLYKPEYSLLVEEKES